MLKKLNKPITCWILGGIAIVAGVVLEGLGWGTQVEGIIVGFGLFLLGSSHQVENSHRNELRRLKR